MAGAAENPLTSSPYSALANTPPMTSTPDILRAHASESTYAYEPDPATILRLPKRPGAIESHGLLWGSKHTGRG